MRTSLREFKVWIEPFQVRKQRRTHWFGCLIFIQEPYLKIDFKTIFPHLYFYFSCAKYPSCIPPFPSHRRMEEILNGKQSTLGILRKNYSIYAMKWNASFVNKSPQKSYISRHPLTYLHVTTYTFVKHSLKAALQFYRKQHARDARILPVLWKMTPIKA